MGAPELASFLASLSPLWPRYDELTESVEEYVLDMLRDQLNRRQPIDNVSRNLLRLLTATCGYKEVRLLAVQRLEMWLQNPKVRCVGETEFMGALLGGLGCRGGVLSGLPGLPAADQASAGPVDVCVHELQLSWARRHGCHLPPDQDPPQAQGAPQSLYALHQVCGQLGQWPVGSRGSLAYASSPARLLCPGSY